MAVDEIIFRIKFSFQNTISDYFPNFSTKANSDDMQKLHHLIQDRNELKSNQISF